MGKNSVIPSITPSKIVATNSGIGFYARLDGARCRAAAEMSRRADRYPANDACSALLYAASMLRSLSIGGPSTRRLGAVLTLALVSCCARGADDPTAAARELFVIAYGAAEAGAPLAAEAEPAELRGYVLYPYLERARLAAALRKSDGAWGELDDEIEAFLAAHAGEPVRGDLRKTWLLRLAARGEWQALLDRVRPSESDPELRCQVLNARIALDRTDDLAAAIAEQWLTPQRLPAVCEAPFDWLRARNGLSDHLVEQRVRLLLGNGQSELARTLARGLPSATAAPLVRWADLLDRPAAALDAVLAEPRTAAAVDEAALSASWSKLTRRDPAAAAERYEPLLRLVGERDERASSLALALALGLSWERRASDALAAFRAVAPADLDDYALGWQTRAALWAGDWPQVTRSIAAMSTAQRSQTRWRYWQARALEASGDAAAARELYAALIPSDNYYAALAAAHLKRAAEPHPQALAADDPRLTELEALPALVRARELLLCGLRGPAYAEWRAAANSLSAEERVQSVVLASRWGWYDVSVETASRQNIYFDYRLLYPRPYDAEVGAATALTNLPPALIYGVIRQESLFRTDAVSSAGAMGLAQLKIGTARSVARAWRAPAPAAEDLLDPAVNVKLAAFRLHDLSEQFDGQTAVALAGYNAGATAAARWLPSSPIDADVWIENIPYNETREYVQRVLWHSVVFAWLTTGKPQSVRSWLAPIGPPLQRTAEAP
jgi:soluble lytic murein transglycosylase